MGGILSSGNKCLSGRPRARRFSFEDGLTKTPSERCLTRRYLIRSGAAHQALTGRSPLERRGDRVSAEGRRKVRRQCAIRGPRRKHFRWGFLSLRGRIASGITWRRRGGAVLGRPRARVPKVSPKMVGSLSGGTILGETRRKGANNAPLSEDGSPFQTRGRKARREGGGILTPRETNSWIERPGVCTYHTTARRRKPFFRRCFAGHGRAKISVTKMPARENG